FSMSKRPTTYDVENAYFLPDAQSGIYKWKDSTGAIHSVNVLDTVAAYNAANGTNYSTAVNSVIASRMSYIGGLLGKGEIQPSFTNDDPNLSGLRWTQNSSDTYYYPTVRIDYNISQKHRLNAAYNQTKRNLADSTAGWWPGDGKTAGYKTNNL